MIASPSLVVELGGDRGEASRAVVVSQGVDLADAVVIAQRAHPLERGRLRAAISGRSAST